MNFLSLVAKLALDKSDYESGLGDAEQSAQSFGDKLKSGLGTAAKVGAAAVTAVAGAATAATGKLISEAGQVAAYGDDIDKASQKMGISAEAYQEWDAVLQHSGSSISAMGIGMKTLGNAAAEGSDAFTALGISTEKAAKMSKEDLFAETITALQNVKDENERAQLAQELFGRSAMELGPLLNTSAEDTQKMRDKVHELGGVMSDEAVKSAAAYQDNLQDMTTAIDGVTRGITAGFLPGLSDLMDGITRAVSGGDYANEMINNGVEGVIEGIENAISTISNIFDEIVPTLLDAIARNMPRVIEAGADLIMKLANAAIEALPAIMEMGVQIITTVATAIAENLPTLIPAAVSAITQIVEVLSDPGNLGALVDGAVAIIIALAEGLVEALPTLIEAAPTIIMNLVTALIENAPKLLEAAVKVIATLAEGIIGNIDTALEAIGQVIDGITGAVAGAIAAALNWGKDLLKKFGEGIGKAAGEALKSVQNFVSDIWNNGFKSIVDGALNWGSDMISNFTNGIKNMASGAVDAVKGLAGRIAGFLHFSEPDEGPLSNFSTYAPDMMKLFAEGIRQNEHLVTDAIGGAFDLQPTISAAYSGGGGFVGGGAGSAQEAPQRPVQVIFEVNGMQQMVYNLVKAEVQRVGLQLSGVRL